MKKIGQKMSKVTKVFLVLALIFSNLSCLSTVFAYEGLESGILLLVDEDNNKIKITYEDEYEEVYVKISEKYTYLDDTIDEYSNEELVSMEVLENGYEKDLQLLNNIKFDGKYVIDVSLGTYVEEEYNLLDNTEYEKDFSFDSGFKYSVIYDNDLELSLEDGVYNLPDGVNKFKVLFSLNMGGISPTGTYYIDDNEYTGIELLNYSDTLEYDYTDHLYGLHQLSFNKTLNDENNELIEEINSDIKVMYQKYEDNDTNINNYLSSKNIDWNVSSNGENDGYLFIDSITDSENIPSVYDLDILMSEYFENTDISYSILNQNGEEVKSLYQENEDESLEEYLKSIKLENGFKLSVSCCDGLTITYTVTFAGDFNDDGVLSTEDIQIIIDNYLGLNSDDNVTMDGNNDGLVNMLDATYYLNILNNISEEDTSNYVVSPKLENDNDDITTGDEFTVNYVISGDDYKLNGFAGSVEYDSNVLELISIGSSIGEIGNVNENKFAYVTNTMLDSSEYTILTLRFKALVSGDTTIKINGGVFTNGSNEITANTSDIILNLTINASDNANVSSLTVNGEEIELTDDTLDYEITVSNDVTSADIVAVLENVGASYDVTGPNVLEVGDNEFTITVTAENGDIKIYKVNVIREEEVIEEETTENTTEVATAVSNNVNRNDNDGNKEVDDTTTNLPVDVDDGDDEVNKESNTSKIIIIILILLVIAALIYLIFKDDDEEEKKANKDINKYKKEATVPKNNNRKDPRDNNNNKKGK